MFIVQVTEGQSVAVGDRVLVVQRLLTPDVLEATVDSEPDPVLIGADRKLEVFPRVFVSFERNHMLKRKIKLLFDAPPSVVIRDQPYERERSDSH